MSEQILRINYAALSVPVCDRRKGNNRQRFRCWLDDGSPVGPATGFRSPALDGARWLVDHGVSPDRLMTTRAASSGADSFVPAPVGIFAKLAVAEPDGEGMRLTAWQPFSAVAGTEKQATTAPAGVVIPDNAKGAENAPVDGPASAGDDASIPATALRLSDAAQPYAACDLRAASACRKDKSNG